MARKSQHRFSLISARTKVTANGARCGGKFLAVKVEGTAIAAAYITGSHRCPLFNQHTAKEGTSPRVYRKAMAFVHQDSAEPHTLTGPYGPADAPEAKIFNGAG